jgi:membrane associated rhomboid family serine protease
MASMSTETRRNRPWWRYPVVFALAVFIVYTLLPPQRSVAKGAALAAVVLAVALPFEYYRRQRG